MSPVQLPVFQAARINRAALILLMRGQISSGP